MKNTLLTFAFVFSLCLSSRAQFFPGQFFNTLSNSYDTIGSNPCIVDSTLFMVRYRAVQSMTSDPGHSVRYLWDRFYRTDVIRKGPSSSLIVLRSNKIYQYFPASDSMAYISSGIASPGIRDISASDSAIWAITNFNQIGKYDGTSWQIISLPNSYNPWHILALNDSSVYLADPSSVSLYSPAGLSTTVSLGVGTSHYIRDWCIDTTQNLWISVDHDLRKITPAGADTVYNYISLAFLNTTDVFSHVAADNAGNIWASTNSSKTFKYDGRAWTSPLPTLPYSISGIAADRTSSMVFVIGVDSVIIIHGATHHTYLYGNMPYQNVKAAAPNLIATDQGIFTYSTNSYYVNNIIPTNFRDSSVAPYANDVTCFVVNDLSSSSSANIAGYGTHHGLYDVAGLNQASLPDTNINFVYYSNGSYYIGTDKGLCVYNQMVYTTFDTTNHVLPSNKVTFITSVQPSYMNPSELWVGTDNGLAVYSNGQWTQYDTNTIQVPHLYVTGILPSQYYYMSSDSTVWVTTLGSGLVKLHRDGRNTVLNTANGGILDDSLYYITQAPACYYNGNTLIGTQSHSVCYYVSYGDSFAYLRQAYPYYGGGNVALHQSTHYSQSSQYYTSQIALFTDQGIDFIGMCAIEGIAPVNNDQQIHWYQVNNKQLSVKLEQSTDANPGFQLYDMSGRQMLMVSPETGQGEYYSMDISSISTGVYILQANRNGSIVRTKIAITK